jgi:hypothetical protein
MNMIYVTSGTTPEGVSAEAFQAADSLFRGAIISVLVDNLIDTYLRYKTGKEVWDALEAQFGVSDAGSELYAMEQFLDYKMVEDHPVVEQAHEIQGLAKELKDYNEENPCELHEKFVAGAIIPNLPHSWRDFATTLKHKRKLFSFDDLVATLDVEEKDRAKDTRGKVVADPLSANFVQRGNPKPQNKRKKPQQNPPKSNQADRPKKKKKKMTGAGHNKTCFVCGNPDHFAGKCPDCKMPKSADMVISEGARTSGYDNSLLTILSICFSPKWWIDIGANIHVCADISMFSSY